MTLEAKTPATQTGRGSGQNRSRAGHPRPAGIFRRASRYIRYRLITPMLRARHEPEYSARSVLVGVVCGLMPILGQSTIVLAVWLVARR